jgi:hypothetical protein
MLREHAPLVGAVVVLRVGVPLDGDVVGLRVDAPFDGRRNEGIECLFSDFSTYAMYFGVHAFTGH